MSVNKAFIIGNLGQDPELKYTTSGTAVTNFSVATNESIVDKSGQRQERTEWHRIVAWGKLAELCSQYLSKGRQAFIEGYLQTRSWEDQGGNKRYTTEIVARNVQFLSQRRERPSEESSASNSPQNSQSNTNQDNIGNTTQGSHGNVADNAGNTFTSDDLPF